MFNLTVTGRLSVGPSSIRQASYSFGAIYFESFVAFEFDFVINAVLILNRGKVSVDGRNQGKARHSLRKEIKGMKGLIMRISSFDCNG